MHCTYSLFLGTQIKKQIIPYIINHEKEKKKEKTTGVPVVQTSKTYGIRTKASEHFPQQDTRVQPGTSGPTTEEKQPCPVPKHHGIYFFIPFEDAGNQTEAFICKADLQFCILALSHTASLYPGKRTCVIVQAIFNLFSRILATGCMKQGFMVFQPLLRTHNYANPLLGSHIQK